jgi:hypothetical protein
MGAFFALIYLAAQTLPTSIASTVCGLVLDFIGVLLGQTAVLR